MEKSSLFCRRLRYERQQRGWSQAELATKLGVSPKSINRWESNRTFPAPKLHPKLTELFGKSLEELGLVSGTTEDSNSQSLAQSTSQPSVREDWGTAPSVENFCGRENELVKLKQWIVEDRCRLVTIVGLGGIGKTMLAAKVAREVKDHFTYVLWYSLQDEPHLNQLLQECLKFLSCYKTDIPDEVENQISLLIECLRREHCLIVLDKFEAILQEKTPAGNYNEGYEEYGRLTQLIGEVGHQSCFLLTSREQPKEVVHLQGIKAPIRLLKLTGIEQAVEREITGDGLFGSDQEWETFRHFYSGNPLALKLAAASVREVFSGNIAEFLSQKEAFFGDIHNLLEEQFQRLPPLEREIVYWLAIEREAVSLGDLQADLAHFESRRTLLEALESLRRRSLVETTDAGYFTLLPMVMEYVTSILTEQAYWEIDTGKFEVLAKHALVKAQTKDYVRVSQIESILAPLVKRLLDVLGKEQTEYKITKLLSELREATDQRPGYEAGNLLNLLIHLKYALRGLDLSHLTIWQAYLQDVDLPEVNFAYAHFAETAFADTFGSVFSGAFNLDGELLATGTSNGEIRLWRTADVMPIRTCLGHVQWVFTLAFSPLTKELLASGSGDGTVRLWDTSTGQCLGVLQGHTGWIRSIAFSPDGQVLASGSEDKTIRLWDTSTGSSLKVLQGHSKRVSSIAFLDDRHLASGSEDQTIRLWDINTGQCFYVLRGHSSGVKSVASSRSGRIMASGSEDQTIRLWDTSTGQCLNVLRGYTNRVLPIAFSPDGNLLISGGEDRKIRLWDVNAKECIKILQGHSGRIRALTFSPERTIIASGSDDYTVRLWDVYTGQCVKILRGHTDIVRTVAFSDDRKILASGSDDKTIRLWDIHTEQCSMVLQGHDRRLRAVTFSPDGKILASGSEDQTIRFWDTNTGQCLKVLRGHGNRVWSVAFSPDGKILASGSEDQTICLWEISNGSLLFTLEDASQNVRSIVFSPRGQVLASASNDGTIKLWNVQEGAQSPFSTLRSERPYEKMNISHATGLTEAQKTTLKTLGAIDPR